MISYAEKQGQEPFDWVHHLNQKTIDWESLKSMSSNWDTCSIGQLSTYLERTDNGKPLDGKLASIGLSFDEAVKKEDAEIALIWLRRGKEIETELLKAKLIEIKETAKIIAGYLKK